MGEMWSLPESGGAGEKVEPALKFSHSVRRLRLQSGNREGLCEGLALELGLAGWPGMEALQRMGRHEFRDWGL